MKNKKLELPSSEYLLECFVVEDDGTLIWKERPLHHFQSSHTMKIFNKRFSGKVAGCKEASGYKVVRVNGTTLKVHRVLWKIWEGEDADFIDHINGKRDDNSRDNLRNVTRSQNGQNRSISSNNVSGHHGVSWHERDKRWYAYITLDGVRIHLGSFTTMEEAVLVRKNKEEELYGEYRKK